MRIPSKIDPGPCRLTALGVTHAGNAIGSKWVRVAIERPDSPLQLKPYLSPLSFRYIGDDVNLSVLGTFADGSKVSLTRSTLTTYASDTPEVVTVDAQGTVTAVGPGSAKIIITNRNATAVIRVTVPKGRKQ